MHYAVHGHTAAALIYERADAEKPHMRLTNWAAVPEGKIVKSDVSIAKNYLNEQEMRSLERIVPAFLDLAEDRAERHIPMTMGDWRLLSPELKRNLKNIISYKTDYLCQTLTSICLS